MKKELWQRYKHGLILPAYLLIYMIWWAFLENKQATNYRVIHMSIDDKIPFCELFVVPYFLWFAYVAFTVLILFFKDKEKKDFYRCVTFLFTGMTIFLIISTIMPNGHHLRLTSMPRDNIFTRMVASLWMVDTPTNLWPSIHVYNSIGAHIAISRSQIFEKHPLIKIASFVLSVSIILSTLFIKQHSMFDVLTAFLMAFVMYIVVYNRELLSYHGAKKKPGYNWI